MFCRLSQKGFQCVLWYGYENLDMQTMLFDSLDNARHKIELTTSQIKFWCGDIQLAEIHNQSVPINTGIISCGIIISNLSKEAIA